MKMKGFALSVLLVVCIGLTACSTPRYQDSKRLTARTLIDLELSGIAQEIVLVQSLESGQPITDWKLENLKMREIGESLPERVTVAELHVTYADAQVVVINVRYGEAIGNSIRDWWNKTDGFIRDLAFAEINQSTQIEEEGLEYKVSYRFACPNPRPDQQIKSVVLKPATGLGAGTLTVLSASLNQMKVAEGNTYFVSPVGNDSSPGSFDQPWASLHKATGLIRPGDTVYVRGGSYYPTTRIVFKYIDAPEGQRTRVVGWPGETANFDFMDTLWDESETRIVYGYEVVPHDASPFVVYSCDRFTLKNLHLQHSRTRGFSMESGFRHTPLQDVLINQGRPEHIDTDYMIGGEILHCSVFLTYGPGIHFARQQDGRCVGNLLIRACSVTMAPKDALTPTELMGPGPVGRSWLGFPQNKTVDKVGRTSIKPPMEAIDSGFLTRYEIAYNDIGWNEAECMLIDGDVEDLRIHHNYVHDLYNFPWVWGIGPNGYGHQQGIEVDHNIAERTGGGVGCGLEGGGECFDLTIHHNISKDCHWNGFAFNGGGPADDGEFRATHYYNNLAYHCGYMDGNEGPAGGMHFPLLRNLPRHDDPSLVKNITMKDIRIINNLVVQPRDYAIAFTGYGDFEELDVVVSNNMTDRSEPGARLKTEMNKDWKAYSDDGLIRRPEPLLRNPVNFDFRPIDGSPVRDSGLKIKGISSGYIGAFGPGANWVEVD